MNREAERKRLAELLETAPLADITLGEYFNKPYIENCIVPHLLDNGIVVPPVKVGDVVWLIGNMRLYTKEIICSRKIISVQRLRTGETLMHFKDGCFSSNAIGVYAFTSREQAEQALKGGESDA